VQSVDEAGRDTQPVAGERSPVASRGTDAVAVALAGLVGSAALVYAWFQQYAVDPEVTLLPWLMRQGWPLYQDLIDQHPPLFPLMLTLLNGDPGLPTRIFIVALRGLTLLLTYVVARRLAGVWGGLIALAATALWALGAEGAHLWYDSALAPIYLGVVLLLVAGFSSPPRYLNHKGTESTKNPRRYLWFFITEGTERTESAELTEDHDSRFTIRVPGPTWSDGVLAALSLGLLLGIAILIKQHAMVAVPGVALAIGWGTASPGRVRRLVAFADGLLLPLLIAAACFVLQGTWEEMAYWAIGYTVDANYASAAAMPPASGEWLWLAAGLAPAVALLVAWPGAGARSAWRAHSRLILAGPWLLLAAILPVWPRYGRFHLQAAVPLLAVAAGVAAIVAIRSLRRPAPGIRTAATLAAVLLAAYALVGFREASESIRIQTTLGPVAAPYAATATPLAAWVDAHTTPGAPIVLYGVDALLYRVLDHPPPRPWAPLLPWIMSAHGTHARLWAGVVATRPQVAIVASSWWYAKAYSSVAPGPEWLRTAYHPAASFEVSPYAGAPLVRVVALLLDK
jgi:hypothetical protein